MNVTLVSLAFALAAFRVPYGGKRPPKLTGRYTDLAHSATIIPRQAGPVVVRGPVDLFSGQVHGWVGLPEDADRTVVGPGVLRTVHRSSAVGDFSDEGLATFVATEAMRGLPSGTEVSARRVSRIEPWDYERLIRGTQFELVVTSRFPTWAERLKRWTMAETQKLLVVVDGDEAQLVEPLSVPTTSRSELRWMNSFLALEVAGIAMPFYGLGSVPGGPGPGIVHGAAVAFLALSLAGVAAKHWYERRIHRRALVGTAREIRQLGAPVSVEQAYALYRKHLGTAVPLSADEVMRLLREPGRVGPPRAFERHVKGLSARINGARRVVEKPVATPEPEAAVQASARPAGE